MPEALLIPTDQNEIAIGLSPSHTIKEKETLIEYQKPQTNARRLFVITPYVVNDEGKYEVQSLPLSCPLNNNHTDVCQIRLSHYRERTTGPCFPLAVVCCKTHKKGFTLYPYGHVPYGRKPLVPMTGSGCLIVNENEQALNHYTDTLFESALDASKQQCWPHESESGESGRFISQTRELKRGALMVGVCRSLKTKVRETISDILCVSNQLLQDGVNLITSAASYVSYGKAICKTLEKLPLNQGLFEQFVECGYQVGLWPQPYICNIHNYLLRPTPFHRGRTSMFS